jgi:hypothetical protein
VRYVRAIFVPEDETCFHLFEAASPDAVYAASERAGLSAQRIVEAEGAQRTQISDVGSTRDIVLSCPRARGRHSADRRRAGLPQARWPSFALAHR